MLELGIDELTIVLTLPSARLEAMQFGEWTTDAEEMLDAFCETTGFFQVFGEAMPTSKRPKGYTEGWTLGEHEFYLALAFHPGFPNMGAVVKVSAQALAYYTAETGKQAYELIGDAWSPSLYELRMSRVDLKADFIDEGVSVDEIHKGMTAGSLVSMRQQENKRTGTVSLRKSTAKLSYYGKESSVQTIYLGSKCENVNSLLVIYDKKAEQLGKKGIQFVRACECENWVRFELRLRHEYARQFTEHLLECANNDDQVQLIAATFDARHRFMHADENGNPSAVASWSAEISAAANGAHANLSASTWRTSDLEAALEYLVKGSGLYPLLWKIGMTWNAKDIERFVDFVLKDFYDNYEPNEDAERWFRQSRGKYRQEYPTMDDWLVEASKVLSSLSR